MAKEALKEKEELEVPTGGIGDFVMDDDEADKVYADTDTDAEESFGKEGIAQFPALAERMAKYGRNEDNMLAHVAEGELVIPAQFLKDEVMKQRIFEILTEAGVEDPEAYVVGAEANDINPTTGLPEFFLKRLFKKVVKGIKSVVKSVVKVVKKVAPIVLPVALAATPLGPVFGPALGSGIGTLLQGGSVGDALKSGLMSGAMGAVTAGFSSGSGSFMDKISNATSNFGDRLSQTVTGFTEGVSSGSLGGFTDSFFSSYNPIQNTALVESPMVPRPTAKDAFDQATNLEGITLEPAAGSAPSGKTSSSGKSLLDLFGGAEKTPIDEVKLYADTFNATEKGLRKQNLPESIARERAKIAAEAAVAKAEAAANPSVFKKYAPLALAGTGVAAASGAFDGFFDPPPIEPASSVEYGKDGQPITGTDLLESQPGRYLVKNLGNLELDETTGQYRPIQRSPISIPGGPFARSSVMQAADGGPVFPRRTGGIAPTEGVPGQDSVKAMLMPGEFVMTTDAVRGLGNGNLNNGIKNMYSVMRNLERRGRAIA